MARDTLAFRSPSHDGATAGLRTRPARRAALPVGLGLILALLAGPASAATIHPLVTPQVETTWTVNSTADTPDASLNNDSCADSAGDCTLRAAIQEANANPGPDAIDFGIPGTGVQVIQLASALPVLGDTTGPTTIDGYSQPGAVPNSHPYVSEAAIRIHLRGPGEPTKAACDASTVDCFSALTLTSPYNVVRGLAMSRFWRKVWLRGSGAHHNVVAGNFIGTDPGGTYIAGLLTQAGYGAVTIDTGAYENRVGGSNPADRNVISGNQAYGVYFKHTGTDRNRIIGNLMGLAPDGTRSLKNFLFAVDINLGAGYNEIGGTAPGEGNVMSGNGSTAAEISHGMSTVEPGRDPTVGNRVVGNLIGTDPTGTSAPAYARNGYGGIHVEDGVTGSVVAENVIVNSGLNGSRGGGVFIEGALTQDTQVSDNYIGVLPNGAAAGNQGAGVEVRLYASQVKVERNVIAYNDVGVRVRDDASDLVTVTRNAIFGNGGLGIELFPEGVNPNGQYSSGGPNQRLRHPAISSATTSAATGMACPGCTVEVFVADGPADVYGSGLRFAGSAVATADGRFTVALVAPGADVSSTDALTATATDGAGNTSEFSLNVPVTPSPAPPAGTWLASDSFAGRLVVDGWGRAGTGGWWTVVTPVTEYEVAQRAGSMAVTPGASRTATLNSRAALYVDASVRLWTDRAAVGGDQLAYLLLRRQSDGNEYRAKLRLMPDGTVKLGAVRVTNGSESLLGAAETVVPGLAHAADRAILVRAQLAPEPVSPGDPPTGRTRIRLKAWADGTTEPTAWLITTLDGTADYQRSGLLGLRTFLQSAATNAPVTFFFDSYRVVAVDPQAPGNDPIPAPPPRSSDDTPPSGSVTIDQGAEATNSETLSVAVPATDEDGGTGVTEVRLSNSPATSGSPALLTAGVTMSYSTPVSWSLTDPASGGTDSDGLHRVYVQWKDGAGNWSAVASDEITLDRAAPTVTSPTEGLSAGTSLGTDTVPVRLDWTGSDATSGVAGYSLQQSSGGGTYVNVSLADPAASGATVFLVPGATTYRFRVMALDEAGNASGWSTGPTFTVSARDQTSTAITYQGSWSASTALADSWRGSVRYASSAASATFTFTGRSAALVAQTGSNRGRAGLYLDGVYIGRVDLYAATPGKRVIHLPAITSAGPHTLRVDVLGTKRAASTGTRVDVDAFVFRP